MIRWMKKIFLFLVCLSLIGCSKSNPSTNDVKQNYPVDKSISYEPDTFQESVDKIRAVMERENKQLKEREAQYQSIIE